MILNCAAVMEGSIQCRIRSSTEPVCSREGICGHDKDDASPQERRPPGAQPGRDQELRETRLHFGQVRRRAWVAPGLKVRQEEWLRSYEYSVLHCVNSDARQPCLAVPQ